MTPQLILQLIKDTETAIQSLPTIEEDQRNNKRSILINKITNFTNKNTRHYKTKEWREFNTTKKFLKEHHELIISRADKGGATVVMYKDDYIREMKNMLEDTTTYKIIQKDPTSKLMKISNQLLEDLKNENVITPEECRRRKTHNCQPPKIYGLRKTHKNTLKLRPVVSNICSPSYELSKILHKILTPITSTSHFNVKDSFEFVESLKGLTIPQHHIMVSLDVISLFTNIPQKLVIEIIQKNWLYISAYSNISKNLLINIIQFCFTAGYFTFNNVYYQQIEGTAMGNPASPVLANLVMHFILTTLMDRLPDDIKFLKLYVDDTFVIIPEQKIDILLNTVNNIHPSIQFTIETEKDSSIPFLDVLIIRDTVTNQLKTDIFKKPTNVGRTLNFKSNHPLTQKINVIHNFVNRILILSDPMFHAKNLASLTMVLKRNNYPVSFSKKIIKKSMNKIMSTIRVNIDTLRTEKHKYVKIPLIPELKPIFQTMFNDTDVKLAFYNVFKIDSLYSKLKDKTPKNKLTDVIYSIPCKMCQNTYIGQTKQYISERVKQHTASCRITNLQKKEQTALAKHRFMTGHEFDFNNYKILHTEKNGTKRRFCEMVFIKIYDKNVNFRTDTDNLSSSYAGLLHWLKNHLNPR